MRSFVLATIMCLGTLAFLPGCDLTTEPYQEVSPEVALADMRGTRGVVLSTYTRLQEWNLYGNLLVLGPEVLADNAVNRAGTSRHFSRTQNAVRAHLQGSWGPNYQLINEANTALEGLDEADVSEPGVTQEEVDRLRGEVLFMRALAYHNLVKVFGYEPGQEVDGFDLGVIIRTEPTHAAEDADFLPRSTNTEVYNLIKDDLDTAISLLADGDRGEPYYGNYEAALALRARVALYEGDWTTAENYATQAMDAATISELVSAESYASGDLDDPGSLSSIFDSAPNPESLFEVAILTNRESLGVNDALSPYLLPRQWQANIPPPDLLGLFEEDDVRRLLYPYHEGNEAPYTIKYNESNDVWSDNVPVIRYPELLLIRAEARYELGDEEGARDDLNTLREARNASEITASGSALMSEILDERRRELAFEGHRFFDLKRRGMDIRKPGNRTPISYSDRRVLAPVPSQQVELNDMLEQNPGY